MISNRMSKIDASGIRKVFELSSKLQNPINLSIGQPDFDVPEFLKEEAIKAIKDGFNKYTVTQGILSLRERIAQKLFEENNIKISPENIIVTSGVSGGLLLVFNVLLDIGDEIIIFDPYFVLYKHLVNFIGAIPVIIDTYPSFAIDFDKVKQAITRKTKAILINSANNPTGKVYSKEELVEIKNIAEENNLVVISDEIYEKFCYDKKYFSIGSIYTKTVTLNGFSKSFAMTGWRIGYASGPSTIIQEMNKLQQYSFVCAPSFVQKAAILAFDLDMSFYIEEYKKKRDFVYNGLKEKFEVEKPDSTFYIFPNVNDTENFVVKLIANNVLVVPGNVFSEKNTHFRISFATSFENLKKGIEIINKIKE